MFDKLKLHRGLQKGLSNLRLSEATEVQAQVIPAALSGNDLLVSSETGSGKTLAYLIPAAQGMLDAGDISQAGTLVLILVPTRELARQVDKHFAALCKHTPLRCGVITGGNSLKYQQSLLRKNPEFIVSTPGRLVELLATGHVDLASLRILVLDEADRMLDMGFREDVQKIIDACNPQRQTLLLSATLHHRGVQGIARRYLVDARQIKLGLQQSHGQIRQQVILCDDKKHKKYLLAALLESSGKTLVFCNTRAQADELGAYLANHPYRAGVLHGELRQEERQQVISQFAEGKLQVLLASDVAARGLDIRDLDTVINFDFPRKVEDYIHRIGRTGRAGRQGLAIAFVSAGDWNPMVNVENHNGAPLERRVIKGLQASFKGPKKLKSNGKAAGLKKRKTSPENKKTGRLRQGKKQASARGKKTLSKQGLASSDGLAPLKKRSDRTKQ